MSNETAAAGNTEAKTKQPEYRINPAEIPKTIYEKVGSTLGKDANVYPAQGDSKYGYKGPVIHADQDFVVQAVGKGHKTAVVHQRSDLEMQGPVLQSRDANNDLVNRNIQVHYRGDQAKVYQWNPEREAQNRERVSPADKTMAAAEKYAQEAFKTPKQREAFMSHMQAVTQEAFKAKPREQEAQQAPAKATPAPTRSAPPQDKQQPAPSLER